MTFVCCCSLCSKMLDVATCSVSGASPEISEARGGVGGEYAFYREGSENPSFFRSCFLSRLLEYMGTMFGVPSAKRLLAVVWGKGQNLPKGLGVSKGGQGLGGPSVPHPRQPLHWKSPE